MRVAKNEKTNELRGRGGKITTLKTKRYWSSSYNNRLLYYLAI